MSGWAVMFADVVLCTRLAAPLPELAMARPSAGTVQAMRRMEEERQAREAAAKRAAQDAMEQQRRARVRCRARTHRAP